MNILLTLGRMPKGLDLARGFAANGCQVYVADPHKKHVCHYSNSVTKCFTVTPPNVSANDFVNDLLNIVHEQHIDLVVPVSEESVYAGLLKTKLPEAVAFFGPGFETARKLHDKFYFNQYLHELGFPAPACALHGTTEAEQLINNHDVVLKPLHASAGIDMEMLDKGSSIPATTHRPSMLQQRMRGRLLTSLSIARDGQCLGTGVYEGTVFTGSVAIAFERVDVIEPVSIFINTFIEKTGYTGFISFDLFIEDDGLAYAIECNPRLTSGIHLFENADVANAVSEQNSTSMIRYRKRRNFQHFWPCLGTTEMSLIKRGPFKKNLKHFLKSADVTWSRHDPLPFLMMNFCSTEILKKYFSKKMSLGEASITDIEWREGSLPETN